MSRPKFKCGDKVLVPHTDKHYPAKVLKSEVRPDSTRHYLLHYTGWNKKWDEWVSEAEIQSSASVKISLPKKREAVEKPRTTPSVKKQLKVEIPEKLDTPKSHRKRKAELMDKDAQVQLQLEIPAILKKQLLDEYDIVMSSQKTVTLPRKPNAMQILRQFYEYGKKELRCTNSELQMLITGLEEYIDKTLEDFLLYEIEWKQASRLLSGGISASSIYGAEHLLRLLVKLPELVPHSSATSQQAAALNTRLSDFLDFLVIHRHTFFANVKDYTEVPDY